MRGSPEDKVRKRPEPNWELGALKRQGQHFGNATLSAPGPSFPHEHSARDPKDPTVIRLGNAIELNPDDDQIRNGKQQKEYWHSFIAVQPMHMLIGNAELSWGGATGQDDYSPPITYPDAAPRSTDTHPGSPSKIGYRLSTPPTALTATIRPA